MLHRQFSFISLKRIKFWTLGGTQQPKIEAEDKGHTVKAARLIARNPRQGYDQIQGADRMKGRNQPCSLKLARTKNGNVLNGIQLLGKPACQSVDWHASGGWGKKPWHPSIRLRHTNQEGYNSSLKAWTDNIGPTHCESWWHQDNEQEINNSAIRLKPCRQTIRQMH